MTRLTTLVVCSLSVALAEDPSPRLVLKLLGVDESALRVLQDGSPLVNDELEPVVRILHVMPRLDEQLRQQWRIVPESWSPVVDNPTGSRAQLVQVRGKLREIQQHKLAPEAADRFGFDAYYQLEIESEVDGRTLMVFARRVPNTWGKDPAGQLVGCDGLFLKTGTGGAGEESLYLATDRLAWYPTDADARRGVSPGIALLGGAAMDVSRLEDVEQQKPLGAADRECFYQMLWAVRQLDPAVVRRAAEDRTLPVARVLQHPDGEKGKVYSLQGTARRVIRIQVDDPDIQQRFGIDHYFEIELQSTLDLRLRLRDPVSGQIREYARYPVTVCVTELPSDMPLGDEVSQNIRVDGVFMKLWSYQSEFVTGTSDHNTRVAAAARQVSPLLIAKRVELLDSPMHSAEGRPGWFVLGLLAAVVALGALATYWYSREDRHWNERQRRRRDEPRS